MTKEPQTIQEYKEALKKLAVDMEIIRGYGDLRKKKTWVDAYNSLVKNPSSSQIQATENPGKLRLSEQQRDLLFGPIVHKTDSTGQFLLLELEESLEPPDPDDYPNDYEWHYQLWAEKYPEVAQALNVWSASNGLELASDAPVTALYSNGTFKPIVNKWEVADSFPNKKLNPKIQKYFEDTDYYYPLEFLIVAFYIHWKTKKLTNATSGNFYQVGVAGNPKLVPIPQHSPPPKVKTPSNKILTLQKLGKSTLGYWVSLPTETSFQQHLLRCGARSPPSFKLLSA